MPPFLLVALVLLVPSLAPAAMPPWIEDPDALFARVRSEAGAGMAPAELLALRERGMQRYAAHEYAGAAADLARVVRENPTDSEAWLRLAWAHYRVEAWEPAAEAFARVARLGEQGRANALYNRACCLARAGEAGASLRALEQSLELGWEDRPQLLEDEDLASLRDDPRLRELAGVVDTSGMGREEGWALDLEYLAGEAARLHWTLRHGGDPDAFAAGCRELAARVAELDDLQMAAEVQRLLASLGDGHSSVFPAPTPRVPFEYLPLTMYFFDDGLHVVHGPGELARLSGGRVDAIGGVGVDELRKRLSVYVSRDNAMGILSMGPLYLRVSGMLQALGAWSGDGPVRVTVDGEEFAVPLGGHMGRHQRLPSPAGVEAPRWLARAHEPFWMEWMPGAGLLYVQYNQVRNGEDESIADFAARLRAEIDRREPRALLLDLRHNSGGNSFLNRPLLAAATHYGNTVEDGRLLVAIGRGTFSAAQNFASELDYYTAAVFVGEPSGSSPNAVGESTNVVLPWSGLRLSISSRFHQPSFPTDERRFIGVAMPVGLSSAQWLAGEDPMLDAVVATLRGGVATTAN